MECISRNRLKQRNKTIAVKKAHNQESEHESEIKTGYRGKVTSSPGFTKGGGFDCRFWVPLF